MEPARTAAGPSGAAKTVAVGPTVTKLQTVSAANQAAKHIGAEGSEFVANILRSVNPPQEALKRVQETCGLSNPLCRPLLTMLDYLEVKRRDAHLHVLNRAREMLLDWIAKMKAAADAKAASRSPEEPESPQELALQDKLERLLIASFKYMGVTELKQVPIEVMNSMTRVPAAYLKQLAEEREIFNELPPAVKQQVFEYDRNLLQQDAVQYIAAYKYEVTTISTALNMHLYVRQRPPLLRKQQGGHRGGTGAGGGTAGGIGSSSGPGSGSGGGLFPPKPGASGGQGRRPGFSVANVLNSMGVGAQQQQPAAGAAGQQQQQRPLRTPPRSPGAGDGVPLGLIGQGGGSGGTSRGGTQGLERRMLRKRSPAITALVDIIGTSGKIYQHLIDLCKVRLQETEAPFMGIKETSYCQLRTQLLMYLHDAEKTAVSSNKMGAGGLPKNQREVATKAREQLPGEDTTYKLAWNLDAAITRRCLTVGHMKELARIMERHLQPPPRFIEEEGDPNSSTAAAAAGLGSRKLAGGRAPPTGAGSSAAGGRQGAGRGAGGRGGLAGSKRQRGGQQQGGKSKRGSWTGYSEDGPDDSPNEYEEDDWIIKEDKKPRKQQQQQAVPQQQQQQQQGDALDAADVRGNKAEEGWLGDAAMILRDPPALHLLAAEVVEVLYRCIALRRLPADEPQLSWLLQLMELAVGARSSLRERCFAMRPVPPIKIKHTAEVAVRGGARVAVELSPEEVVAAWSRTGGKAPSEQQQQQRSSSSDAEAEGEGVLLPPGQGQGPGRKGYDWHKRTRQGREYEMWFTDHDQLTELWPEVMAVLAEGEMLAQPWQQDPADADVAPLSPGWKVVVGGYAGNEVVRQVVQMLVLDRIRGGDLVTAYRLLRLIVASAHLSTPGADREYGPFGFSLVVILHELASSGRLSATSKFWRVAFEGVLLKVVDAEQSRKDARVHKALLDLLKTVAKQLRPEVLAGYLGTMLEATKDTRTRLQDRQEEFDRMLVAHTGAGLDTIPGYVSFASTHHDWSDGFRLVRKQKYGQESDGLSGDYTQLLAVGGLQGKEHLWPQVLRDYVHAAQGRQRVQDDTRRAERAAEQQQQHQQAAAWAAGDTAGDDAEQLQRPTQEAGEGFDAAEGGRGGGEGSPAEGGSDDDGSPYDPMLDEETF